MTGSIKTNVPLGQVLLVGAGPGDPDLLTLRAARALGAADVVLHDRLVSDAILVLAPQAELIETGKAPGLKGWTQDAINAEIIAQARRGRSVVRLKSGDPLIFGRADEEMDALDAAGIEYAIVPGITAAIAAAASSKASLTRRGRNAALRFMTGQDVKGFAEQDWRALARDPAAAIYMGVAAAHFVQGRLMVHGAAPGTPVTVVENASRPEERRLATTLGRLAQDMAAANVTGPAVILLGLAPRAEALRMPVPAPDAMTLALAAV
jgi:uroporphyrin-III C-methyltransferase